MTYEPDLTYALKVNADSIFSSKGGRSFRLMDDVNFDFSSSFDTRKDKVSKTEGDIPTHFTLTKKVTLESGFKTSEDFTFGECNKI